MAKAKSEAKPASNDAAFEALVAKTNEAYENTESSGSRWLPDVGQYDCVLAEVKKGVKAAEGANPAYFWLVPVYTILDHPVYANDDFDGGWFSNRDQKALGRLKGFIERALGDDATNNLTDDIKAVESKCGSLMCKVTVKKSPGKDRAGNKVEYTNVWLDEVTGDAS